jgi:hypothetical protein
MQLDYAGAGSFRYTFFLENMIDTAFWFLFPGFLKITILFTLEGGFMVFRSADIVIDLYWSLSCDFRFSRSIDLVEGWRVYSVCWLD